MRNKWLQDSLRSALLKKVDTNCANSKYLHFFANFGALENEMKLKGRQVDALWLFFKSDKIYKNYMKCRLCREQLYFGGLNNKQVIRSLKVHVRIKHPQKWNEFQRKWRTKKDS